MKYRFLTNEIQSYYNYCKMVPLKIPQIIFRTTIVFLVFVNITALDIDRNQIFGDFLKVQCGKGCLSCTKEECLHCNTIDHWEIDQGKFDCKCMGTYFQDQHGVCKPCQIIGCWHCQNTQRCIQCDDRDHWIVDDSHHCECQPHYFNQKDKCQHCIEGCLICSNNKSCKSCDSSNHYHMRDNLCVCKAGYYNNGKEKCLKCQVEGCKHCSQDPEGCQACFVQDHYILVNSTCQCEQGYYSQHKACASCMLGCEICNQKAKCQECKSTFQKQNDICICEDGKYYEEEKCFDCVHPCATCKNRNECKTCVQGYDLENNSCQQGGLSAWIIILIVVGAIAIVGIIIAVIVCCWLKIIKRRPNQPLFITEKPSMLQKESLTGSERE